MHFNVSFREPWRVPAVPAPTARVPTFKVHVMSSTELKGPWEWKRCKARATERTPKATRLMESK